VKVHISSRLALNIVQPTALKLFGLNFSDLAASNNNYLQIVLWFRIFLYICIPLRRKGNSEKDKEVKNLKG
jgi:hypothetical protein